MACKRVRVNSIYHYVPVMIDELHPPIAVGLGKLKSGDIVRVVNLPGCPKANTMGHAHFQCNGGEFGGLCCTNSLLTPSEYADHLRARIAQIEANRCKTPGCDNNGELIMGMRAALCTECIAMPKQ
jgi:hypothetical protein